MSSRSCTGRKGQSWNRNLGLSDFQAFLFPSLPYLSLSGEREKETKVKGLLATEDLSEYLPYSLMQKTIDLVAGGLWCDTPPPAVGKTFIKIRDTGSSLALSQVVSSLKPVSSQCRAGIRVGYACPQACDHDEMTPGTGSLGMPSAHHALHQEPHVVRLTYAPHALVEELKPHFFPAIVKSSAGPQLTWAALTLVVLASHLGRAHYINKSANSPTPQVLSEPNPSLEFLE